MTNPGLRRYDARMDQASRIAQQAVDLRRTHGQAPALDVLDLVFQGVPPGAASFPDPATPDDPLAGPRSPFGQLVAEAFDRGMVPEDWMTMTGPRADPRMVVALIGMWCTYVLPRFRARFSVGQ